MNGGSGQSGVADRNAQLVKVCDDIPRRIQALDAGLLMVVDLEATDVVRSRSELKRHL